MNELLFSIMSLKSNFTIILFFGLLTITSYAFTEWLNTPRVSLCTGAGSTTSLFSSSRMENNDPLSPLEPSITEQFKIKICSSESCTKRSKVFGLEEYALYSGMYQRKEESGACGVQIEEGSCMGQCKVGPCVGVEHEDYEGFVGLEGMEPHEMSCRVFQNIVTEGDLDRVWACVEHGIRTLAQECIDDES